MIYARPTNAAAQPTRILHCPVLIWRPARLALFLGVCVAVSAPMAVAQTDTASRVAFQVKQKVKFENRKPLDSDAAYVCTLSGFGNLAHCYPRQAL